MKTVPWLIIDSIELVHFCVAKVQAAEDDDEEDEHPTQTLSQTEASPATHAIATFASSISGGSLRAVGESFSSGVALPLQRFKLRATPFQKARPPLGFMITLATLTLVLWRHFQTDAQSPICTTHITLSHVPWDVDGLVSIHILLIGLCAWACHVATSFFILGCKFIWHMSNKSCCKWLTLLASVLAIVALVALATKEGIVSQIYSQKWVHAYIGLGIWAALEVLPFEVLPRVVERLRSRRELRDWRHAS
jgi:hypothetical protein